MFKINHLKVFLLFLLARHIVWKIKCMCASTVVRNPGPQVTPVLHVLDVSLLQHTWFKWLFISRLLQGWITTLSFESGVLEQGNMQDRCLCWPCPDHGVQSHGTEPSRVLGLQCSEFYLRTLFQRDSIQGSRVGNHCAGVWSRGELT